ncbi:DUF2752 domain-containing protein [Stenotrophomonas tumulicola]|uniref:DUF2752 domain-containing protein n=1 Tax=Stenotrophomonas tumulicola TaxID=1685415 RepID=A0A7W3FMP1_9GAMM|nr:DUF2752 domain-containing protein [Stenotrophomonas tumulicola]MBA8682330.1 DUF2752 domain-containing protein [Stenotrophomonas tumulicola]
MSISTATSPLRRWLPLGAAAALAAGATLVLRNVSPYASGSPLPSCPLYALTGLYCPGCGSTRCLHSLVHFDLAGAMAMNPLLVISLPFLLLMLLYGAGVRLRALDPLMRVLANPMFWLVLLVGYALLRNLPWAPFTALAPG